MRLVFADSGYWIATINSDDELSEKTAAVVPALGLRRLITSEMVLIEVLNHFSGRGELARSAAWEVVEDLMVDPDVEVIPISHSLFTKALDLYGQSLGSDLEFGGLLEFRADGRAGHSGCVGL